MAAVGVFGLAACGAQPPRLEPPSFIAHAGGVGNHRIYTNSREAVEHSLAVGHGLIELDLSWTTDGRLVMVHDWEHEFVRIFGAPAGAVTFEEFTSLQSVVGISQLTEDDLGPLLLSNPGLRFVTDVKERNVEGLRRLAAIYPGLLDRFVPQIYQPAELEAVRDLGFDTIILTLYRSDLDDQEVLDFAGRAPLWAVTMPGRRAAAGELAARLAAAGLPVYAHTVNDRVTFERLRAVGVHGVYTDWMSPADASLVPDTAPWPEAAQLCEALEAPVLPFVPWGVEGLAIALDLRNPLNFVARPGLRVIGGDGKQTAVDEMLIEPESTYRADLSRLRPDSGWGWVVIDRAAGLELSAFHRLKDGEKRRLPLRARSCTRFSAAGPGTGVDGLLLAVVNPTAEPVSYRLQRRIGGDLIDDETVDVDGRHQVIRVYRSRTDQMIEVAAEGAPMAAATLRWDPFIRVVW
jgi:glycerophosphoryl diester phosphodiesterase